jgi:formylglycine-generating enzyme required for sulfatase activity
MFRINKLVLTLLSVLAVAVLISSCKSKQRSRTTGWEYNNPENGGFEVAQAREQITGPGLILIEGGTFTMGATEHAQESNGKQLLHGPDRGQQPGLQGIHFLA